MEKQSNPGLWIGAAALAAVIVMLVVMPGKKEPVAQEGTKKTEETKAANVTKPPAPPVAAVPAIPPVVPVPPASPVASALPANTQPPPNADDAPPPAPPKPMTPADRENTVRVLDNIQFALRDYRTALGGNPVGTNAEITNSLLGNNLKQVKIPLPDGTTVNGTGEMCDPWGTPLFFHQQSGTKMEIRSAGPDKQMHTPDDVMM
jgi:hypothetical protein